MVNSDKYYNDFKYKDTSVFQKKQKTQFKFNIFFI